MVQNSLGATWLATYPDSQLKGQMEFYIEPAEQTPEVQAHLAAITPESLDPEALTLIDPACGSGHILVEAYDLLKAIYLERGYRQRDIPELILTKNLYGLDICPRAAQLAAFSLLMKGREDDRRLLERGIRLNVMALQDSIGLNVERLAAGVDLSAVGVSRADVRMLAELFTHATTFGSLIQVPALLAEKLPALSLLAEQSIQELFTTDDLQLLGGVARQASILARRYDAVVANPPYMGGRFMNPQVKLFADKPYPDAKGDLFACFIERGFQLAKGQTGINAMVTMESWMFLSSFSRLRGRILKEKTIATLLHLSGGIVCGFGTAASIIRNMRLPAYAASYSYASKADLGDGDAPVGFPVRNNRLNVIDQSEFSKIPESPIAYWASIAVRSAFEKGKALDAWASPCQGMATTNNDLFLRCWPEISFSRASFTSESEDDSVTCGATWFPYNKGGKYRKWFGNNEYLVNYWNKGQAICSYIDNSSSSRVGSNGRVINRDKYFRRSITWSFIGASLAVRHSDKGAIFDIGGSSAFPAEKDHFWITGLLCSAPVNAFMEVMNPTLNFQVGNVASLPVLLDRVNPKKTEIESAVEALIALARADWNAFERSWEFKSLPLLSTSAETAATLESCHKSWVERCRKTVAEMKRLEEANNNLFIDIYALQDQLHSDVPIDQITLTANPAYRYGGELTEEEQWSRFRRDTMAEFLSYATGCMMGRYSLDQPGLILADSRDSQASQLAAYEAKVGKPLSEVQFKPDPDGIIPDLDSEWFEDDIVARTREFLEVTFPESTVTENLRFIEDSLGKDIRKYFCSEFYKDHLQTYKKRPIYWMVQSPKKGFACLIYLHRYTKDTLNQVLNNYFRPYLQKLEARLAQLGLDQLNDDLPTRERTAARKEAEKITKVLKECQAWEQDALLPLAQQRIELDLDDGVKVNYLKLQDVLAPIPGLAAKED